VYNATATHVHFTKSNYKKTIDDLKAGGMTNFVAAFEKVTEIVSKTGNSILLRQDTLTVFYLSIKITFDPRKGEFIRSFI
jgi:hypothetical protein